MTRDLEQLAQKLDRVVELAHRLAQSNEVLRSENARLRDELALARRERDGLQGEQSRLTAKIVDAQSRIHAILEKLPVAPQSQQLTLLGTRGENAGEKA